MTKTVTRACWQPWDSLNIAADGQVYPCCVIHESLVIGDLNVEAIDAIVAGDRMLTFKRRILAGELSGLFCQDCCNAPMKPLSVFKGEIVDRFIKEPEQHLTTPEMVAAEPPMEPSPLVIPYRRRKPLKQKIRKKLRRFLGWI